MGAFISGLIFNLKGRKKKWSWHILAKGLELCLEISQRNFTETKTSNMDVRALLPVQHVEPYHSLTCSHQMRGKHKNSRGLRECDPPPKQGSLFHNIEKFFKKKSWICILIKIAPLPKLNHLLLVPWAYPSKNLHPDLCRTLWVVLLAGRQMPLKTWIDFFVKDLGLGLYWENIKDVTFIYMFACLPSLLQCQQCAVLQNWVYWHQQTTTDQHGNTNFNCKECEM